MITKPLLQNILPGIQQTEDESKQKHVKTRSIKQQEKNKQVIRVKH
jgi:hypothetical protein